MVTFSGWEMPVQYGTIIEEHQAVRRQAGLFDVSHMGEVIIEGNGAIDTVQALVTNDASRLDTGDGLYTPMCYPTGGIIDDITVFRIGEKRYLMIVNAATTSKDLAWIQEHRGTAQVHDISREMALIALQGPAASAVLGRLTRAPISSLRPFQVFPEIEVAGRRAFVSRTGYTGEDGFEIGPAWDEAPAVWDALLEAGKPEGLRPAGLAARDSLRLEAGLMLYGNDIDETTTPLEAPLGWTVKWAKGDFIGRDTLLRQREEGPARRLIGFKVRDKAIARHGYPITHQGEQVGHVTSGSHSPTLGEGIGMAYVPRVLATEGSDLGVEIRSRVFLVVRTRLPFYRGTRLR